MATQSRAYAYGMVDAKRALAKLRRAQKKIEKASWVATDDLLRLGKNYAKQIVPYDSGQTHRAIMSESVKGKERSRGRIFIKPLVRQDGHIEGKNITTVELVEMMHRRKWAKDHFRSGKPDFMYQTRDYLNKIGKRQVRGTYKSINFS